MGFWLSTGAYRISPGGGPVSFRFSSEFDCSIMALEGLALTVSVSMFSLCISDKTGPRFISLFSFRMLTRAHFPPSNNA